MLKPVKRADETVCVDIASTLQPNVVEKLSRTQPNTTTTATTPAGCGVGGGGGCGHVPPMSFIEV